MTRSSEHGTSGLDRSRRHQPIPHDLRNTIDMDDTGSGEPHWLDTANWDEIHTYFGIE